LSGSGTAYTATFTGAANTDISNASVTVTAGSYSDTAGDAGAGGSTPMFTVDTVAPTVTAAIDSTDVNVANDTATVTFTFSKPPVDFSLADVISPDGTLSNLSGSGTSYTATFTANTGVEDPQATVSVTDGSYHDADGNSGAGSSTPPFTVDTVTPTVTAITASPSSGDKNTGSTITLTVTFSQNVTVTGAPALTLNDGGTAMYKSGSSTNVLTFTYAVANGQNTCPGRDREQSERVVHCDPGRRRQRRQPFRRRCHLHRPSHRCDRELDHGHPVLGRSGSRQDGHVQGDDERGGDDHRRHPLSDAERRRQGDLQERFGHEHADFRLRGRGSRFGAECRRPRGDGIPTERGYVVAAGQNTADLKVNGLDLNGGAITDGAGNNAVLSGSDTSLAGTLIIDTTPPKVTYHGLSGTAHTTLTGTYSDNVSGVQSVAVDDTTHPFDQAATLSGGTWSLTDALVKPHDALTIVATDNAGNTTTLKTTAPAGLAGHPINLGLANASLPHGALATITVSGVPSGWTLNAGTSNGKGVWTVQTANPGGLAITPSAQFAGALTLNVTETWTQTNGSTATTIVADNVAAFAPQSPIYAWSGDDNLTGKGGNDLFAFSQSTGDDTVYDFNPTSDQLDLTGVDDVESFSDIQSDLSDDSDGDAVITLGAGETITIMGVAAASLSASNFVFNQTAVLYNDGSMTVDNGAMLPLSGVVDNSGTIYLGSTGAETDLEVVGSTTLQGGGQVVLSDNSANVIYGATANTTLTNVDNTISGAGQIGDGQT
jgi:hypothetical protein